MNRFMRMVSILVFCVLMAPAAPAASRLIIDDDAFVDKVTATALKLEQAHQLVGAATLRKQVRHRSFPVTLAPVSQRKLDSPDLHDRLLGSTVAVGSFYKCPDCGDYHFNGSAGFVVADKGIICTCCHVVLGEDEGVKESYLIAADSRGQVYPIRAVLAADTESDTCWLQAEGLALKPLPLRPGVRTGERVYCLSHPGGYYFMFTQGLVARLNSRRNDVLDAHGKSTGQLTRPILFLNVTAEFAPGSSGAPIADECGNVVAQVASIADAGETDAGQEDLPPSPSVPVRFCTAAEELLRLGGPDAAPREASREPARKRTPHPGDHSAPGR